MTDSIPISSIFIPRQERQRREIEDDKALQGSILRNGLIHPIVVKKFSGEAEHWRQPFELVAGERRLRACAALGWESIPVRWMEDLSTDESKTIELEENLKRQDLSWQDTARAVQELHKIWTIADPKWNQARTAEALSLNEGSVSTYLLLSEHLDDPRVSNSVSGNTAKNLIRRRNERASEAELSDLAEFIRESKEEVRAGAKAKPPSEAPPPPPPKILAPWSRESIDSTILCEDFHKWALAYSGPSFNLIHFDPPYGKNVFGGEGQFKEEDKEAYEDQEDLFWRLTNTLRVHIDKLLGLSGHLIFWMDSNPLTQTKVMGLFRDFLSFYPHPLIWHKSDNSGIVGDSQRWPRHVHEAALLGIRGRRSLVKTFGDSYAGPGDRKLHPSCKPEPMLRHFFSGLVDEHTRLLDPCCGSGSSLRAAESLGAKHVLGLESSPRFCGVAREALQHFRQNRRGSEIVKNAEYKDPVLRGQFGNGQED